jgi:hypothetical protein
LVYVDRFEPRCGLGVAGSDRQSRNTKLIRIVRDWSARTNRSLWDRLRWCARSTRSRGCRGTWRLSNRPRRCARSTRSRCCRGAWRLSIRPRRRASTWSRHSRCPWRLSTGCRSLRATVRRPGTLLSSNTSPNALDPLPAPIIEQVSGPVIKLVQLTIGMAYEVKFALFELSASFVVDNVCLDERIPIGIVRIGSRPWRHPRKIPVFEGMKKLKSVNVIRRSIQTPRPDGFHRYRMRCIHHSGFPSAQYATGPLGENAL